MIEAAAQRLAIQRDGAPALRADPFVQVTGVTAKGSFEIGRVECEKEIAQGVERRSAPEADAELIAVAATFLRSVGLSPERAVIYINNRRLMESEFEALGIVSEKRLDVSNLIDRRSKMEPQKWDEYALEIGLSEVQRDGLKAILSDGELWKKSDELRRLF